MGCALLLIRIINTGNQKLWLWFGLLAGLGLETKHSMLIFGFALIAGLVLTPQRKHLFSRWLLLGGVLAFLLFLPNLLWNIQHHFPFLELQENIRRDGRNVSLSFGSFFGQEMLAMLPLSAPIWIAGLWWLLRGRYRALAFAWVITAAHHFRDESAHLLPVPRVPHALCRRRRAVRSVAARVRGSPGSSPSTAR